MCHYTNNFLKHNLDQQRATFRVYQTSLAVSKLIIRSRARVTGVYPKGGFNPIYQRALQNVYN